jgi:hypothetical protein
MAIGLIVIIEHVAAENIMEIDLSWARRSQGGRGGRSDEGV